MKILCAIYKYFPYGGLQKDFLRIVTELARRGHQVTCFTSSWEGEKPSFLRVEITEAQAASNHKSIVLFEKRFQEYLAKEKPDRSFTFTRIQGADFYFAGDDCYAALLEARHNPILKLLPRYRCYCRQEESIFRTDSPTKILYLTEHQKQDYQRFYRTQEERFIYLPPSGDPSCGIPENAAEIRRELRRELQIPEDAVMLLQVAADFPCKGTDRAIQLVSSLPEKEKVFLVLVGGGPEKHRSKFVQQAEKCGIRERTVFTGPRNDVSRFLLAADLMIHPARKEAAGTVLYEALKSGLPVICSGVCGYAPLVQNAGCPVMSAEYQEKEWQTVLAALLKKDRLAELRKEVLANLDRLPQVPREIAAADAVCG